MYVQLEAWDEAMEDTLTDRPTVLTVNTLHRNIIPNRETHRGHCKHIVREYHSKQREENFQF